MNFLCVTELSLVQAGRFNFNKKYFHVKDLHNVMNNQNATQVQTLFGYVTMSSFNSSVVSLILSGKPSKEDSNGKEYTKNHRIKGGTPVVFTAIRQRLLDGTTSRFGDNHYEKIFKMTKTQ